MHHIAPFPEDYTATAAYYTCARDNHIYVLFRHPQQAEDGRHATTEAPAYGAVRLRDGSLYFWNVPENQLNDTLDAQEFSRITNDSIEINIETVPPRPIAIDMGNRYATRIITHRERRTPSAQGS